MKTVVYDAPSLARRLVRKKIGKVPAFLLIVVLIAGLAAAQIVSLYTAAPNNPSGVKMQWGVGWQPPASPILNTLSNGTLQMQGIGGFGSPVMLVWEIDSTSASDTCSALGAILAPTAGGATGSVQQLPHTTGGGTGTAVTVSVTSGTDITTGMIAPGAAHGCKLTVITTSTYTVTSAMLNAFEVQWSWTGFPAGTITFEFAAQK